MPMPFIFHGVQADSPDFIKTINEVLNDHEKKSVSNPRPTVQELEALARMRQKRLCPEDSRLLKGGGAVRRHLEFCESCRERLEFLQKGAVSRKGWPRLAKSLDVPPGAVGQLRDVKSSAGGLVDASRDEYLFNPPLVLVVQVPSVDSRYVRVAQIHGEPELAGPGDVAIELPDGIMFAESWNTYPMLVKNLGPVVGMVPREMVQSVLREEKSAPPEVAEDSPMESFRELETEIAYHFCRTSVSEIMEEKEKASVSPYAATVHEALQRLIAGEFNYDPGWGALGTVWTGSVRQEGYAAASAYITTPLEDSNTCSVAYEDGSLSFSMEYVPSHARYVAALHNDQGFVPLEDDDGNIREYVLLRSEKTERRKCRLDEHAFELCTLVVMKLPETELGE